MKEHVIINLDRTVNVPESMKKIGIQYDHNVKTIAFDCPRYPDENQSVDMSSMKIFINWMLPDKTLGSTIATNVCVDSENENLMHFDWVITKAVTSVSGVLSTLICIKETTETGEETYHWNSELIQSFKVGNGMECTEQIAEQNIDVITQLLVQMDAVNTRTSEEALERHVEKYLTENPPTFSDQQADESVRNYMEENAQTHVDDYLGRNPLTLDETLTDPTKAAPADSVGELKGDIGQLSEDKVENPLTGVVGQILEIETVDESGKPKTYKAVNKPSDGGEVTDEQISNAVDNYMTAHPFTETDPTVPDWAKQPEKPTYTASEVGALPVGTKIPSKTSDLQNDSGFLTYHQDLSDYALKSEVPKSASDVGADASGTAESKVSEHNISDTAHNDIRLLVHGLTERLNALADSDDTTLDQMSEVVAYIKNNKNLIDDITTSKVNVSDIINNLTTNLSNKVLSASMGVELKKLIDAIKVPVNLSELAGDTTHRTVTDAEKTAWNNKSTFSGNYNDLTNKPSLFSGNYNDLSGKPTLITEERVNELINEEMLKEMLTKVSVSDIVDDLTTNVSNKPLSAAQGVALKALIDAITIPDTLPNPNALTFTGAVTGSYDGSTSLSVNIPSVVTDDHINELINTALNAIGVAEEGTY